MDYEFLQDAERASFTPTEFAANVEAELMPRLGMKHRYEAAQLMLGRSLVERALPAPPVEGTKWGKPIKGDQLFTDQIALWLSLFILDGHLKVGATVDALRDLVQAHWDRGAKLLLNDWEHSRKDRAYFARRLAELLPDAGAFGPVATPTAAGPVRVKPGSVGLTHPAGEPASFVINSGGATPHIALMGKVGSGKTRTGIQMLRQITEQSGAPFLLIDPKGDFAKSGRLDGDVASFSPAPQLIEVGAMPIPLDFSPDLSQGRLQVQRAAGQLCDTVIKCCRGAGQVQRSRLLAVIEGAFEQGLGKDLAEITRRYQVALANEEKPEDSVLGILKRLSTFGTGCFSAQMSPDAFFGQSWVISLSQLPDELRPLCVMVIFDTLKSWLQAADNAPIEGGHRMLKHVLVVDEARKFLKETRSDSLVDIIRQMRSKGSCAMLLSQDPSDFEGEEEDFTSQLGAVIAFACNQSKAGLRSLRGVYGRALQEREFSDTVLTPGLAFCKLPNRPAEQVRCWEPNSTS